MDKEEVVLLFRDQFRSLDYPGVNKIRSKE